MKVTLFGAAFDPPHLGHQKIVSTLLEQNLAEEVWLLPVKDHAFGKEMISEKHRLAMLQTLVKPKVRIETYELDQTTASITFNTLRALRAKYPEHEFSFLIGADNLARFHEWDDYLIMLQEFAFFIYPRAGYELKPLYPGMEVLTGVKEIDVSSTQIKEWVRQGKSIKTLVSSTVGEYIRQHKLYG